MSIFEDEVNARLMKVKEYESFLDALVFLDAELEFKIRTGEADLMDCIPKIEQLVANSNLYHKKIVKQYIAKVKRRKGYQSKLS